MALAIAAMTFTSCGNNAKPAANADADTTVIDSTTAAVAPEDVQTLTNQLGANLKAKDASAIATLLTSAKTKAAEIAKNNPEQAKQYVAQLQAWVKNNAAALKNIVTTSTNSTVGAAVSTAIGAVSQINPDEVVTSIANAAKTDAKAAGEQLLNNVKQGATDAVANSKVGETVEKAKAAKEAIENAPAEAQKKANEKINEATQKASEKANKAVNDAASKALKGIGL